ncbi:hypothetical protein G9A89_012833 [Geosiphon pyriformis]|nr:hypothetical protein G9A89_012833 [Geosiphon pyriformis]
MELAIPLISPAVQIIGDNLKQTGINNIEKKRLKTSSNTSQDQVIKTNNKFKVATTPNTTTLEYHQSIYTHCKQRFNIPDGIEVVKKSVYQYIENCINNYLFRNYNISEVRSNLYNNLVHYSQLGTEDLNSETLITYFQELNFNIIEYCKEKYPVQPKYSFNFESETETSNKGKQKVKQYSRTTPNTPILPKTTAKHLQTSEQRTSVKLPLSITLFPISLVQLQTPSSPFNYFSRPENFHANIINYLQKNESNHSESLESKKTEPEPEEATENKEEITTAYIAKIPEFTGEDNNTSPQEWLDKVQKTGDANGWNAAKMLKFENLEEPFENWQAFKDAFLQQFTDNNTSITLKNYFRNIKQETSETVIIYLGRFNKLLRQIQQLETNDYYSNTQILDQFIAELKDKLIKKVCPYALADLATAIKHAKNYEIAMEKVNHTKLVNLTIGETSSAAEEKIDQLTKKVESYFTNQQQQQQQPQKYQPLQSNPSNNTILPAQIAQNANLSDIFSFEFEANESPFLLSNAVVNEQKAITAIYTEATLMQQLQRTVDRPAETVIVTADSMKKTPVGKIDNFPFTIDEITIPVKVLIMDAPQYQALVENDWLLKANANLDWETQELKISY